MLIWALKDPLENSHEREIKSIRSSTRSTSSTRRCRPEGIRAGRRSRQRKLKEKLDNVDRSTTSSSPPSPCFRGRPARCMRHYDVQLIRHGPSRADRRGCARARARPSSRRSPATPTRSRARASTSSPSTTTSPAATPVDGQASMASSGLSDRRRRAPAGDAEKRAAYKSRHHLRPEQRVRLRLPPRQHEVQRARLRSASSNYAIVDEVDSILIDEARTAHHQRQAGKSSQKYKTINEVIPRLPKDEHHIVDEKGHSSRSPTTASTRPEADGGVREPLRPGQPRVAPHPRTSAFARTRSTSAT